MLVSRGKVECNPIEVPYDESKIEVLTHHIDKLIADGEIFSYSIAYLILI